MKKDILGELEVSIQMASSDFVLIPPLYDFFADDECQFFDLLFYQRNIRCLIPVYLKFGDLDIGDVERMKLNLQVLDEYRIRKDDEKPIGFILCVQDNTEHVELVQLEQNKGQIYKNLIIMPLRKIFAAILRDAVRHVNSLRMAKFMVKHHEH